MRLNRTVSKDRWGASSTDSEDCSSLDDDPRIISVHLTADPGAATSVKKAYQGMVDMLDEDLQVLDVSERNRLLHATQNTTDTSPPDVAIPCLATVLFFNGSEESNRGKHCQLTNAGRFNRFSKPDLLENHMWKSSMDALDFEKDFKKDCNDNDIRHFKQNGRKTPSVEGTYPNDRTTSGRRSPFLKYDAILKESRERERKAHAKKTGGYSKDIFDLESSEAMLEARKQLETWPWEFHHRANTTKGISQCQSNSQDFYAYQPHQDVTRLYGDVIDTTKISQRKSANIFGEVQKEDIIELVGCATDEFSKTNISGVPEKKQRPVSTTDYPLMAVREVHYGRKHLRYTLFVSDTTWTDQVEFYRLLLRRHEVTLRDNFCFFTVYSGEHTDIQFALKKLSPKQYPVPLRSTTIQFKVHNMGHVVPLLPYPCKPMNEHRWQTCDHDGNVIVLDVCPRRFESDTSSSYCDRALTPLEDAVTSTSEFGKHSSDDECSLERLDSFVEPELPHRMPLLKPNLYATLSGSLRFGRRMTNSLSPGSSSSNSPERRPRFRSYTPRLFSDRSLDFSSTSTLPSPKITSSSLSRPSSRSVFSESSDDPENTNFYRRAKTKRDVRRRSDGSAPQRARSKDPHRSRSKSRHKTNTVDKGGDGDEVEFYV